MTRTPSTSRRLSPPSREHLFGTDQFGRDLFVRTAFGGRISIGIGFAATIAIMGVGITYGAVSGFLGGWVDNGMMRFLDALYGLPYLPFAIITLAIFGTVNFWTMVVALTIASWFTTARVMRGQIITLKENDYVRAAHAVGARWYRSSSGTCCRTRSASSSSSSSSSCRSRPRRGLPLLHRTRDQPAECLLGNAGAGRVHRLPDAPYIIVIPSLHRLADPERVLHRRRAARRPRSSGEGGGGLALALLEVEDLRTFFKTRAG